MATAPALAVPLGLDSCRALLEYDPRVGARVVALKNRDERALVTGFADGLVALVPPEPRLVVTWAPTSRSRTRQRGFDQAELLARAVARRARRPVRRLLTRQPGAAQSGAAAGARWAHPGFQPRGSSPPIIVLIDDVSTTGATLSAAASALRRAGAEVVHGLVVARVPPPRARAASTGGV
jgi:predicted amidophosphoribosyltransferase